MLKDGFNHIKKIAQINAFNYCMEDNAYGFDQQRVSVDAFNREAGQEGGFKTLIDR